VAPMSQGDPIQLKAAEHIVGLWQEQYREHCSDADVIICGSIRRKARMVRDIDVLILDADMHGTFQKGSKFQGVELNLCFVNPECKGSGMLFLTGDYKFNIRLRGIAKSMGMKLNRYGLWRGDEIIASKTEHDIFKALKLNYTAPENRSSPDGQKGILVYGSQIGSAYEVFIKSLHGFDFCTCKGFQYRNSCRHLGVAMEKV